MLIRASKRYKEKCKQQENERHAPRRIVGWLIVLALLNSAMLGYIIWLLSKGGSGWISGS